jgi:hypothetical protein
MPKMKQSQSKKSRLIPREFPHDREAGGSGSAGAMNLRERAPKRRNEEQEIDLGGDTGPTVMRIWKMRPTLTLMFIM